MSIIFNEACINEEMLPIYICVCVCMYVYIFTNPSARAGYDTRSIFKWSLQVWIQSFPSPRLVASPRLKNLVCPTIYPFPTTITITPPCMYVCIYTQDFLGIIIMTTTTKIGRKTTVWTFQATNKRNLNRENLDMAKKGKPLEKN